MQIHLSFNILFAANGCASDQSKWVWHFPTQFVGPTFAVLSILNIIATSDGCLY